MKLLNLNPKSYVLSCVNPSQMSATEALTYMINNMFVFEETIFVQLPSVVNRFKEVLDEDDYNWLIEFFFTRVYVEDNNTVTYDVDNAVYYKCVLEILLECKYTPREAGAPEMPIPKLPDKTQLDVSFLDPLYTRYAPTRVAHYHQVVENYYSHKG